MGPGAPRPAERRPAPLVIAAATAWTLFALIAWSTFAGAWSRVDAAAGAVAAQGQGLAPLRWVSAAHAPDGIRLGVALAALGLLVRRRAAAALGFTAIVLGGATLNHIVKHVLQRPRPGLAEVIGSATDFAFPSGHVANATLLYGALVGLTWSALRTRRSRVLLLVLAGTAVAGVAMARLALGAHRLSDVAAAPPLALGWMWCCFAAAAWWRGHRTGERR